MYDSAFQAWNHAKPKTEEFTSLLTKRMAELALAEGIDTAVTPAGIFGRALAVPLPQLGNARTRHTPKVPKRVVKVRSLTRACITESVVTAYTQMASSTLTNVAADVPSAATVFGMCGPANLLVLPVVCARICTCSVANIVMHC